LYLIKHIKFSIMRKLLVFLTLFFTFIFGLNAQLMNVKMSKAAVNAVGDTVNIDVTVTNFTNLIGAQFSINWDSTKFRYGAISNKITTALPGLLEIGFPSGNIKQGQVTFSWNDFSPASLPNDTRLFTIRLKAVGAPCDSIPIVLSDKPTKSEYYDDSFANTFIPTSTPGQAKINGSGCTGGGGGGTGTELVVKAPILTVLQGKEICIPLTVTNFKNIEGAQSKIKWDPAVLKLKTPIPPIKYDALPSNVYNTMQIGIGEFTFVWLAPGSTGPVTIPNGDRLMEICFEAIGPVGSMTTIDLLDAQGETEYINGASEKVPFINMDGKVTIVSVPPKILELNIGDVSVTGVGAEINVPFTVKNYTDIKAFQFAVIFDPAVLQFVDQNTIAYGSGAFATPNRFNVSYNAPGASTTTLPDGSLLFNLKFKVLAPCTKGTTPITVNDLAGYAIEFIDKDVIKVPYTVKQGSVNIICDGPPPPTCEVKSKTDVICFGQTNGAITVEVTNAEGCQCAWKKDGVAFGAPISTPNCNLSNIGPGVYTLEIICGNEVKCSSTATITAPTAINVVETITNLSCGTLGAISLSVTGGVSPYTYSWTGGITASTKDISGLSIGTYNVEVKDASNCSTTKSYTVTQPTPTPLNVVPSVVNIKCFGDATGSIKLTTTGGCSPYNYSWQGDDTNKTDTRLALIAGSYTVTVSDASSPSNSVTQIITVAGPTAALNVTSAPPIGSTGANGSIDVSVSGGTQPYEYKWEDSSVDSEDRTGLASGTFNLIVTDANGCIKTGSFVVPKLDVSGNPSFGTVRVSSQDLNAGFGISCVNLCDGVISGVLGNSGKAPFTVTISGASTKTITLNEVGPFSFNNLCVGNYTVKVTDSQSLSTSTPIIEVTQPTIIKITSKITCADGVLPIGAIDVTASGGAGSYKYNWSNGKTTEDIENLQQGTFTVVVSDANGCQETLSNIVKDCSVVDECFKEFTNIMTPNDDGANDFFKISCAPQFDNELFVYDRYGKLVYSQKNYDNLWNGKTISGTDLPENAYMWVMNVKYNDGSREAFKGAVTILRN
jgi:gliding motility-associated-like protein